MGDIFTLLVYIIIFFIGLGLVVGLFTYLQHLGNIQRENKWKEIQSEDNWVKKKNREFIKKEKNKTKNPQEEFKKYSKAFLVKMNSVSDFYNIIIARGNMHKQISESMNIKADYYNYFAESHKEEYLLKYNSGEEKNFYPEGLNLRKEKFSFIVFEFEALIKTAVRLKVNFPTNMYYDYCAANSSLLGVKLAIEEIEKINKSQEFEEN